MYFKPCVVTADRIHLVEIFWVSLGLKRVCMLDIVGLKFWRNKGYCRPWMNMGVSSMYFKPGVVIADYYEYG